MILIIFLINKNIRRVWHLQGFPATAKPALDPAKKNDPGSFFILWRPCPNRDTAWKNMHPLSRLGNRDYISHLKVINGLWAGGDTFFSEWQEDLRTHVPCPPSWPFNLYALWKNDRVWTPSYRKISTRNLWTIRFYFKEPQNGTFGYLQRLP